jgi:S1-C subfamily serine protease
MMSISAPSDPNRMHPQFRSHFIMTLRFVAPCLAASLLHLGVAFAQVDPNAPSDSPEEVIPVAPIDQEVIESNSIVKVNVTSQAYSPRIPWQKQQSGTRRGLGVVLEGEKVLVTGQIVADATYIELELPASGRKLPAKVSVVDYEASLALLESADPAKTKDFFAGLTSMEVDASATTGDALEVWQAGRTGDVLVTPLQVSKVSTQGYVVPTSGFLVYEATGIIRSEANSFTLPVIKDGKLAGLLLRYDSKNQVATVLPTPIIEHFLTDVADGSYQGFPSLGVKFEVTMDDQFREYLGLEKDQPGVFVSSVLSGGSAEKAGVEEGDIMLAVNGREIDSRGDYKDPIYGALSISHEVRGRAFVGDSVELRLLRDGEEVVLKGKLARKEPEDYLVWPYMFDRAPRYLLNGGLLFQELSRPYLDAFGDRAAGGAILRLSRIARHPEAYEEEGRKKVVFLSAVLPTPSTQGYQRLGGQVVDKVNGRPILDMNDLDAAFNEPKDGLHVIELADYPHIVHLDAVGVERDNLQLMNGMFRVGSLKQLD